MVKRVPTMRKTRVQSLGWEDLLEKEMATHSSILLPLSSSHPTLPPSHNESLSRFDPRGVAIYHEGLNSHQCSPTAASGWVKFLDFQ